MTQKPYLPQPDDEIMEGEHEDAEQLLTPAQRHVDDLSCDLSYTGLDSIPAAGADGKSVGDLLRDGHELLMSPDPLVLTTTQLPVTGICPHCKVLKTHCSCPTGNRERATEHHRQRSAQEALESPGGRSDRTTDRQLPKCPICKHQALPMIVVEDHPVLSVVFGAPKVCTLCFGEAMNAAKGMLKEIRKRQVADE